MTHVCPKCGQPLHVYPQPKSVEQRGGKIVVTAYSLQAECTNRGYCPRYAITRELTALLTLTDEQAAEYHVEVR